uniref:Uncharacterized protein n=1 Tax=Aegilops tauschii subsp. strangulata TaxID=200361 RepID=A0A453JI42_AEGTS
ELRTTGTRVASTSPQLRGRICDSLRQSSRRMSYAAQERQPARLLPLSFHESGSAGRWSCWASPRTCYLVDPASSHMLVSKIMPCMCKYEPI